MAEQAPLIGATGDAPAVGMTPGQASLVKQVQFDEAAPKGSSRNPRFQRSDTTNNDLAGIGPQDVTVDLAGKPRVGPYQDTSLADDFKKQAEANDMAEDDRLEAEVMQAAAAEQTAKSPDAPMGAAEYFKPVVEGGGDLLRGIVETPAAAVVGVKSAINLFTDLAEEISGAIDDFTGMGSWKTPTIVLDGDKSTPVFDFQSRDEVRKSGQLAELKKLFTFDAEKLATSEGKIQSTTGKFVKSASQFATGWAVGGKALKGWKVAGGGAGFIKALGQGAIADFSAFDAQEGNLSSMLNEMAPEFRNPVTEFLSVDEETPEMLGRAKNALEGAGLGAAIDVTINGLRAMKAMRKAKAEVKATAAQEGYQIDPTISPEAAEKVSAKLERDVTAKLKPAGTKKLNAAAKTVNTKGLVDDLTGTDQVPNAFDLPMHTFDTPEDVQRTILKMVERNAPDIDAARRGVQTWAETGKRAEAIDAIADMAVRKRGDAINAETVVAYKQAMIAADEKLTVLAKALKESPEDLSAQLALRRAAAASHAIKMEFMGARAEAGRALQAFKITEGANPYRALDLETQLREAGGSKGAQELADSILAMQAKKGHAFDMVSGWDHAGAILKTTYVNGLLSGPGTPIANVLGSTINLMQDGLNRLVADVSSKGGDAMADGESIEYLTGLMGGMRDAWRFRPAEALPEGIARSGREEGRMMSRSDDPRIAKPWSAAAFQVDDSTPLGLLLNVIDMGIRSPQIVNQTADDYFAAVSAQGSIRASAYRTAMREGEAGGWTKDQIRDRQGELMAAPTREMLDEAEKHMKEMTFTRDDGGFEQKLQGLRKVMDTVPTAPIGTALMPFVRTPSNIISTGIRNGPLAPFSARWRDDIAAGGLRKQMALTQLAVGTSLWGLFMEMNMNGDLTGSGPRNRAQRQAMEREGVGGGVNWQPNSVRVGDRWYQYTRFEPLGQSMGMAADMMELLANSDWDEGSLEENGEVLSHVVASMGKAYFDKNMLNGTFDMVSAFTGGDPAAVERELGNRGSGAIPFSGALRAARRLDDPHMRETTSIIDDMINTLPGQSDDLAFQRDLWGKPRTYQSGLGRVYDTINLVKTREAGASTIDLEILEQGVSVTMPTKSFTIDGVNVSLKNHADIYSEFVRRAGEPAFEQLEAVVTGNHPDSAMYFDMSDGPNGEKAAYIKGVVSSYRKAAKDTIMVDYAAELARLQKDALKRRENARGQ
jgi:hypothetical protein